MRRAITLLVPFLAAAALGGCAKKLQNGECQTSDNCKDQAGYGKVCVQGRCQECGGDTDCKAGFVCRSNKCEPRPECEGPADCASGKACQDGKCVAVAPIAECGPDKACVAGQDCVGGKCTARPVAAGACTDLGSVYFDYDRADIRPEARETLAKTARCMEADQLHHVQIEGNCDERGTAEYNMHLGQRRAEAVKKYLSGLGVSGKSLKTVSYGKERPVCTEHDEICWQKNRRADAKR